MTVLTPPFLKQIRYLKDAEIGQGYPFSLAFLQDRGFTLTFDSAITVFAGENGSGKSTLLEAIADHIGLGRGGGSRDHRDVAGDPAGGLASMLRFSWLPKIANGFFFRAETYFELVRYLEETAKDWPLMRLNYGMTPLDQQSHGEAFLALFENRLGNNRRAIYLFDEPEAALSPQRLARFVRLLRRAEESRNVQILMATHSPVLMGYPGAQLLDLGGGAIRRTSLVETDHFRTLQSFFVDPDAYYEQVFAETDS
ncbi:MAG: AAA family ATPase [Dongiaceae bacterium]